MFSEFSFRKCCLPTVLSLLIFLLAVLPVFSASVEWGGIPDHTNSSSELSEMANKDSKIEISAQEWWTEDHLHVVILQKAKMPSPGKEQAKHFLNFKNNWVIEAEGLINQKLKNHPLEIEAVTAGESSFGSQQTLTIHVIFKQTKESDRHKLCNIMAFVYTTDSPDKDLKKSCSEKLEKELASFQKDWKVLGTFRGSVVNSDGRKEQRTHWEAVIGVK